MARQAVRIGQESFSSRWVEQKSGGAVEVTLQTPITLGTLEVSALTLAEPNMGQLEQSESTEGTELTQALELLAVVSGNDIAAIRKMSPRDFKRCQDVLKALMGNVLGDLSEGD